ncbi:hypothetical protein M413DRAFT_270463 [Hebeloma cylindrosporum]|uniref:Major facilitator superfamily (MFS) profile domain-containing protein n=1 Tax=Hebeloma cylindrosporum TaxID=76867 RepID=A0A0C3CTH4_HEBCY|nr:hypothetical protein M413DRAFT_270463 [Hebeloma cylindrosporum h7]
MMDSMSTTCLDDLPIQTSFTTIINGSSKPISGTQYDLQAIPTYLSERTRRPSSPTSKNSDLSNLKEAIHLQTLSTGGTPLSHILPGQNPEDLDNPKRREDTSHVIAVSYPPTLNLTPRLSKLQKRNSMVQFLALCWCIFLVGWNDGSTGPLLPRIQEEYRVGFSVVSLIFVGNCAGFLIGATLNVWLNDRFGFGKTILLGAICQLAGYITIAPCPPFPVLVCVYVVVGFGNALQNVQSNGFVGSLHEHMSTKLGFMHASYGLGAFLAPFASTFFSGFTDRRWGFHFILSAGLCLSNIAVLLYVFRLRRQEDILLDAGQEPSADVIQSGDNKYKQIFALRAVPLLTIFALIYIGVEVTLGGWIVTFIIRERAGGNSAGYISSGFFGGLTLGRVCLMWLNKMVGERRIIFFYSVIAIGLELTVWFVPSIIGNAVAVSIIGLVLGPMFPLLVSHMTRILPRWLLTGSVGLVTGIGMVGSAALPFITGLLASKYGIGSLQPLMVSMMGAMLVVWAFVPGHARKVD